MRGSSLGPSEGNSFVTRRHSPLGSRWEFALRILRRLPRGATWPSQEVPPGCWPMLFPCKGRSTGHLVTWGQLCTHDAWSPLEVLFPPLNPTPTSENIFPSQLVFPLLNPNQCIPAGSDVPGKRIGSCEEEERLVAMERTCVSRAVMPLCSLQEDLGRTCPSLQERRKKPSRASSPSPHLQCCNGGEVLRFS